MKNFFILLSCALMLAASSCASAVKLPKPYTIASLFDYSLVTEKYGVGFTESNSVNFEYEAIGSLSVIDAAGYLPKKDVQREDQRASDLNEKDDIYFANSKNSLNRTYYVPANAQRALDKMGESAQLLGGDYVINLTVNFLYGSLEYKTTDKYILTGMVVKRK